MRRVAREENSLSTDKPTGSITAQTRPSSRLCLKVSLPIEEVLLLLLLLLLLVKVVGFEEGGRREGEASVPFLPLTLPLEVAVPPLLLHCKDSVIEATHSSLSLFVGARKM